MSTTLKRMSECANFLTKIWGTEDQGLYALVVVQTKPDNPKESRWHDYPFKWPKGLKPLLSRIASAEQEKGNVYICPALYKKPQRDRESVAGTHCFWVDSDGNAPTRFEGAVPQPSLQIRTSSPKNIHHYWLLDEFLTDIESIETANRSLTAYLEADASGWDVTQLLRPPGTTNRKNGLPVRLLKTDV